MSASRTSVGQAGAAAGRGRELAAVLAQLGLDVGQTEQSVDLLLGRARRRRAAARRRARRTRTRAGRAGRPLRAGATLWARRAGEVLQQVAEALGADDAQVDAHAGVRPRARGGLARRGRRPAAPRAPPLETWLDHVELAERGEQRVRLGRRGDDVEVLDAVGQAPDRAGERDLGRLGPRARSPSTISSPSSSARGSSTRADARLAEARRPARPGPAPRTSAPARAPCAAAGRARPRAAPPSESMPSSSCNRRARLAPSPGRRVSSTRLAGNLARSFSAAGMLPGLRERENLLLQGLADAGQLGRAARPGQGCDRRCRVAHRARRVAVGHDPVHDRAVELVEVAELLQRVRDLRVGRVRHVVPRRPDAGVRVGHGLGLVDCD